jgi:hypothetical protein
MSTTNQISGAVSAASTFVAEAFVERAAAAVVRSEATCTPIFRGCPCVLYPVSVLHVNAAAAVTLVTQHHAASGSVLSASLTSANATRTKKIAATLPVSSAVLSDPRITKNIETAAIVAQCLVSGINAQAIRESRCVLVQTPSIQALGALFARMEKTLFINNSFSSAVKLKMGISAALKQTVTGAARARCFHPAAAAMPLSPNASFAPVRTAILQKSLAASPAFSSGGVFLSYMAAALKTKPIVRVRAIENLRAAISCRARLGREPSVLINKIQDNVPPDIGRVKENSYTNATTLYLEGITERDTTLFVSIDDFVVSSFNVGPMGLWYYTTPALSEGLHTFSFTSFDSKRNYISRLKSFTITVDTVAPKPPVILRVVDLTDAKITIPSGSTTKSNLPLFRGFAETGTYIEVGTTLTGQASANNTTQLIAVGPTGSWRYTPTLLNGSYSFSFKTVDRAANKSAAVPYGFIVDTETPNPPVVSSVNDNVGPPLVVAYGGLTNDPQPTFYGTAAANTTLKVRINADKPKTISGGTSWTYTPEKIRTGTHTFYFTSTNAAGTTSTETKYKIKVDVTNPTKPQIVSVTDSALTPPIPIKENQPSYANKPKFEGRGQKNAKLFVSIDDALVEEVLIDSERKWEYTAADELTAGTYVFAFIVEDPAGNQSKPSTFTLIVADPDIQPITARPVMRVGSSEAWWTIRPSIAGQAEVKMCVCPRVIASLPGPSGQVSLITKKEKIRVIREEYGDKNNKKYIWRIPVVGEGESCACEFIHLAMYTLRDGPWRVGQEREVVLLLVGGDGAVYPQTTKNGEYRVVKVMNRMYDIYPPNTFWRGEPTPQGPVMRQFINTDTVNYLYVWEGCGDGFFLINASCD